MKPPSPTPAPPLIERLLGLLVHRDDVAGLCGDLREERALRLAAGESPGKVRRWHRRQVVRSLWPALARRTLDSRSPHRRPPRRRGDCSMTRTLLDLRFAVRMFRHHLGFTLAIVATLALGIGSVTAVFGLANGVLLRPLPFADPDELMLVWQQRVEGPTFWFSAANARDLAERVETLEAVAVFTPDGFVATGGAESVRIGGAEVSPNLPAVLGLEPVLGRGFAAGEEGAPVAMVSHAFWRDQLGGGPDALGRTLELDGEAVQVVGVLPPDAIMPLTADVWIPVDYESPEWRQRRGIGWLQLVGRRADGVTETEVAAELDTIARSLAAEYPDSNTDITFIPRPLSEELLGNTRAPLTALLGAVALVLTAICANVGGLLLAWSQGRAREVAIRVALGSGSRRIAAQFLTESLVLAIGGGALGIGVAILLQRALVALAPVDTPRLADVGLDGPTLALALAVTLASGLLFGMAPAVRAARLQVRGSGPALGSRGVADGSRSRTLLVSAQIAFAVVLVVGAVLLGRSLQALRSVDPGFATGDVLTLGVPLIEVGFESSGARAAHLERIRQRAMTLPGVQAAALINALPLRDRGPTFSFGLHELPPDTSEEQLLAGFRVASADYFDVLDIEIVDGRDFLPEEHDPAGPPVAIVDEAFAAAFFPERPVIGSEIDLLGSWRTVVGVVSAIRDRSLETPPAPRMYVPMAQGPRQTMVLALRVGGDPAPLLPVARAAIREIDPQQAFTFPATMAEWAGRSVAQSRFLTTVLAAFALTALLLCAIGIYGLLAYTVGQRRREIGIRMAIGAVAQNVRGLVVGQALRVTGIGLLVGGSASLALGRLIETMLYEVPARDPATVAVVLVVLGGVAAAAAWLPARRATRVDPISVLRAD